jgi:hypothetical protein
MFDTAPVTTAIAAMIRSGMPASVLLATVASTFPHLSLSELSQALQVAQAQAERKALRPH